MRIGGKPPRRVAKGPEVRQERGIRGSGRLVRCGGRGARIALEELAILGPQRAADGNAQRGERRCGPNPRKIGVVRKFLSRRGRSADVF
jgi:hypothetical protein